MTFWRVSLSSDKNIMRRRYLSSEACYIKLFVITGPNRWNRRQKCVPKRMYTHYLR